MKSFSIYLLFYLITINCLGQDLDFSFRSISVADGLSQASVNCIVKDSLGFVWLGTLDGLNRFDGTDVKVYRWKNDTTGLFSNTINDLLVDSSGRLWVAATSGLNYYSEAEDKFIRTKNKDINSKNSILRISLLDSLHLFILTTKKLYVLNISTLEFSVIDSSNPNNKFTAVELLNSHNLLLADNHFLYQLNIPSGKREIIMPTPFQGVNHIRKYNDDTLFISGNQGVYMLSLSLKQVLRRFNQYNRLLYNDNVNDIEIINNELYVGTDGGGLSVFNFASSELRYSRFASTAKYGLVSNYIRSIYIDKDSILWLGQVNGLSWTFPELAIFKHLNISDHASESGNNQNFVWFIHRLKEKHYWVGTLKKGLYRSIDTNNLNFKLFKIPGLSPQKQRSISIYCLTADSLNNLFIGTDNGLVKIENKLKKSVFYGKTQNFAIINIFEDDSACFWLGTVNGLVYFNPQTDSIQIIGASGLRVNKIKKYKGKKLIIASEKGLFTINLFDFYSQSKIHLSKISENITENLVDIYKDSQNSLWISGSKHLFFMDTLKNELIEKVKIEGKQKYFYAIEEDDSSRLWLSSGHGIYTYNRKKNNLAYFDEYEGVRNSEFNAGAAFKDKEGQIFFGGVNGVTYFDPKDYVLHGMANKVILTKINLFNNEIGHSNDNHFFEEIITAKDSIYLAYNQNYFRLEFCSPQYRHPERSKYAYRLSPMEKNWHYASRSENFVQYTNLATGGYIFMVKAINAEGEWSAAKKFYIFIDSPIWQKAWFIIILIFILLSGISIFIFYREKQLKKYNDLLERKIKYRTDEILKVQREVESQKKFTEAIIENALDGIAVLDVDGKFIKTNEAFGEILGYTKEEILKSDYINLSPPKWRDNEKKLIESLRRGEKIFAEKTFYHVSGKTIALEMSASSLNFHQEKYFIIVIRDISHRKQLEKQLQEYNLQLESKITERTKELQIAKERAESADKLKTDFLANLSHEVRTPMNAINGFAQLLGMEHIDLEQKKRFVSLILENSSRLIRMIEDIVDLSKFETNQIEYSPEKILVNQFLKDIYSEYKGYLDLAFRDLELELKIVRQNIEIESDPHRLKQIINHLLENAVKYTEKGKIIFGFEILGQKINFFVQDQGIGIPAENLKKIFNVFEKPDFRKDKLYRGLGVGLALVKANSDLLHGNLVVQSELGKGTRFELFLPLDFNTVDQFPESVLTDISFEGMKFLVAEDEETNYEVLSGILKTRGATVVWAQNGQIAVDQFNSTHFDLLFLDLKMPILDGIQVARQIRKVNTKIPIIVVTAFNENKQIKTVIKAGADFVINKPYHIQDLLLTINKFL